MAAYSGRLRRPTEEGLKERSRAMGTMVIHDKNKFAESLVFMALGLGLFLYSKGLWVSDTPISMSPYLFPFMIGAFFFLLALILLSQSLAARGEGVSAAGAGAGEGRAKVDWKNVGIVILFSVAYCALLPLLHFVVATVIFLFGLLYVLGEKRLWLDAVLAVGTTAFIYVTFGLLLSVMLP